MITKNDAYIRAIDLAKTALSSGSIKFQGPNSNGEFDGAETDSKYLNVLIDTMANNIYEKLK